MRRQQILALTGLALAGILSGCAAPTAIMVASQALTGVSYLTTGKGTTDHVLSAAMEEDCALHRVISGVPVCKPPPAPMQTASLDDLPPMSDDLLARNDDAAAGGHGVRLAMAGAFGAGLAAGEGAADGEAVHRVLGLGADMFFVPDGRTGATGPLATRAPPAPERPEAEADETPAEISGMRYYLVLGTFSHREGADLAAADARRRAGDAAAPARVVPARINGRMVYRVVVGPSDREHTLRARRQLADAGLNRPWPVPACGTVDAGGCISTD